MLSGEPFGVIEVKQDDLTAPEEEKFLALSEHKLSIIAFSPDIGLLMSGEGLYLTSDRFDFDPF